MLDAITTTDAAAADNLAIRSTIPATIIILTVSLGYIDFFFNWRQGALRLGIKRYLLIAEDQGVYDALVQVVPEGQVILAPIQMNEGAAAFTYNSTNYNALVSRRPTYLRAVLALGRRVLYTDVDTILLRNPFLHFDAAAAEATSTGEPEEWDLQAQSDVGSPYVQAQPLRCSTSAVSLSTQIPQSVNRC
jgi:hypothetical protein